MDLSLIHISSGENVAEEILTSDTGDRDSTADASEEVEITIVDDVEDEAFTSGDGVTVTSPVKEMCIRDSGLSVLIL